MPPSVGAILRSANVPAFLTLHPTTIRYWTGMVCSEGALLLTPRRTLLFLDDRYATAAAAHVSKDIMVRPRHALRRSLRALRRCGIESEYLTLRGEWQLMRLAERTTFVRTDGIMASCRRSKDVRERRLLREADRITQKMLQSVPAILRPGIRETDVAWQLRAWAHAYGAEDVSFAPIVAFGSHTGSPHHQPGARRLKARDIVLVDCGARYRGYCGDRTQMFFVGRPTLMQERALIAVREAKDAVLAEVRAGVTGRTLDGIARSVLRAHRMEHAFVHALGHGIGLDVHEGITLTSHGADVALLCHEVITVEPGVYFPGLFGIRLEEVVTVTRRGVSRKIGGHNEESLLY